MQKEMSLDEFKMKITDEIIKSCDRGVISFDTKKYVSAYRNSNFDEFYIPMFMTQYISLINDEVDLKYFYFFNEEMSKNISLFLGANICNFFKYRDTYMFSFLAKYNESDKFGFLGILYLKDNVFRVVFPKNSENEFFKLSNMGIGNLLSVHFSKRELFESFNILISEKKEKLIESFEEFLEVVLSLDDENEKLIRPLGEEFLKKLKDCNIK